MKKDLTELANDLAKNLDDIKIPSTPAVNALLNGQQADFDGVFVKVSRQAIDEVLDERKNLFLMLAWAISFVSTMPEFVRKTPIEAVNFVFDIMSQAEEHG